jgi:hypothetical protein
MALDNPVRATEPVAIPHQREGGALEELPLLIPIPRAAQLLGISRSAAYRCAACGDLPTTHLGGRVYVVTSRLQSMLESA